MKNTYTVIGLSTGIIRPHDPFVDRIIESAKTAAEGFHDGDVLVLAETAVATAEGHVICLDEVKPSPRAEETVSPRQGR